MRLTRLSKQLSVLTLISFLFLPLQVRADVPFAEAARLLPDRIGEYQAAGTAVPAETDEDFAALSREHFNVSAQAERVYSSAQGKKFTLRVFQTPTEHSAYAGLTTLAQIGAESETAPRQVRKDEIGTASLVLPKHVLFFKGSVFVIVSGTDNSAQGDTALLEFARSFAETLDKGEGEVPVLVKHLPDWEQVFGTAAYAVTHKGLQGIMPGTNLPEVVSFEGGAEAVAASYGPSRLVIIEHTTPQLASDNDARINARLAELKSSGQPVPSGYRRVGNYAVFVFNAPDQATATALVDKVAYEQVVQWLGNNPRLLEQAQREYSETTAGVILSVVKASGLSLLICLAVGGIFGSIIFRRRRAQAAATEAYSDAGGMLRLNLDEITPPPPDPSRLLGKGDS